MIQESQQGQSHNAFYDLVSEVPHSLPLYSVYYKQVSKSQRTFKGRVIGLHLLKGVVAKNSGHILNDHSRWDILGMSANFSILSEKDYVNACVQMLKGSKDWITDGWDINVRSSHMHFTRKLLRTKFFFIWLEAEKWNLWYLSLSQSFYFLLIFFFSFQYYWRRGQMTVTLYSKKYPSPPGLFILFSHSMKGGGCLEPYHTKYKSISSWAGLCRCSRPINCRGAGFFALPVCWGSL